MIDPSFHPPIMFRDLSSHLYSQHHDYPTLTHAFAQAVVPLAFVLAIVAYLAFVLPLNLLPVDPCINNVKISR